MAEIYNPITNQIETILPLNIIDSLDKNALKQKRLALMKLIGQEEYKSTTYQILITDLQAVNHRLKEKVNCY